MNREELKKVALDLVTAGRDAGCRSVVVAIAGPDGAWQIGYVGQSGVVECLGLAHQAVRSVERLVDSVKYEAPAGETVRG